MNRRRASDYCPLWSRVKPRNMPVPALQSITEELLIDAINRTTQRVVMIGPGVWPPLA